MMAVCCCPPSSGLQRTILKHLEAGKLKPAEQSAALRGVADKMAVFQIP